METENRKVSYLCPECGEVLTFDFFYLHLVDNLDIKCPHCGKTSKGSLILNFPKKDNGSRPEDTKESEDTKDYVEKDSVDKKKYFTDSGKRIVGLKVISNFIDENGSAGGAGSFYEIVKDKTIVGRRSESSMADIQIVSNRYMSRHHVAILKIDGRFKLEWIASTNPPLVNGEPVAAGKFVELKNGYTITLGQCQLEWKDELLDENISMLL